MRKVFSVKIINKAHCFSTNVHFYTKKTNTRKTINQLFKITP